MDYFDLTETLKRMEEHERGVSTNNVNGRHWQGFDAQGDEYERNTSRAMALLNERMNIMEAQLEVVESSRVHAVFIASIVSGVSVVFFQAILHWLMS